MITALGRKWWVLLLNGLGSIAFGLMTLAWPSLTLGWLIFFFAGYCLIDGITALMASAVQLDRRSWWQMLVGGLISLAVGIMAFAWPGITAVALLMLIAVWSIARGGFEIAAAIALRKVIHHEWLLVLAGVASILFGLLLLAQPAAGALAMLAWIGAMAIARGVLLISLAFRVRSLQAEWDDRHHGIGHPAT